MTWFHDHPTTSHLGVAKAFNKIRQNYYWHGMFKDVENWVESSVSCTQKKHPGNVAKASSLPIPVAGLLHVIIADCVGPLSTTLVMVHSGQYAEVIAAPNI